MTTDLLQDFSVIIQLQITWGDMDAFQHVNNTVYFKHFENVRIAYLQKIGFIEPEANEGVSTILAHTQCRYKLPLVYPDSVSVGARVTQLKKDRFFLELQTVSEKHQKIAAIGTAEMVAFDYRTQKKALIPERILKNIESLEGKNFTLEA